ncbi:MAG: translation initiation factor IF-3 [Phycisphaerae bacterium]|nr:translation initiation factor IF-3 [Phycisphaerae bacterium]
MTRAPRFGPGGPPQRTRVNHFIRITPIRVIGADGEQVGVVETSDALRMAADLGLDLVEISPDARPPVCKIMDFGKFKYEQSKKEAKNRASSRASEMKEVRLGRSVKIDPHDVQIRVNQSRRFLMEGHKVLITQRFKGREMAHRELGINRLKDIANQLSDIAKLESSPRWMGPQASIILAPDKAKVDAAKRAEAKAKAQADKAAGRAAASASPAGGDSPAAAPAAAPAPSPVQP